MRGFDYRSDSGVALLVAKLLDNDRALKQAYGRVGRYDEDDCLRSIDEALNTIKPIDESKAAEAVGNIRLAQNKRRTMKTNSKLP